VLIDIQEQGNSIVFTINGEEIEFTEADLASIGINANVANEMLKEEKTESH
jgi:hypothetical protein